MNKNLLYIVLAGIIGIVIIALTMFGGTKGNNGTFNVSGTIGTLDNSSDNSSRLDSNVDTSTKNITNQDIIQEVKINNDEVIESINNMSDDLKKD